MFRVHIVHVHKKSRLQVHMTIPGKYTVSVVMRPIKNFLDGHRDGGETFSVDFYSKIMKITNFEYELEKKKDIIIRSQSGPIGPRSAVQYRFYLILAKEIGVKALYKILSQPRFFTFCNYW